MMILASTYTSGNGNLVIFFWCGFIFQIVNHIFHCLLESLGVSIHRTLCQLFLSHFFLRRIVPEHLIQVGVAGIQISLLTSLHAWKGPLDCCKIKIFFTEEGLGVGHGILQIHFSDFTSPFRGVHADDS